MSYPHIPIKDVDTLIWDSNDIDRLEKNLSDTTGCLFTDSYRLSLFLCKEYSCSSIGIENAFIIESLFDGGRYPSRQSSCLIVDSMDIKTRKALLSENLKIEFKNKCEILRSKLR